jgi:L-fuconolactonase
MPFGGLDWLALTQEPILEPDLPICDAHHHFWDLRPARVPYQRYLLHELAADIGSGHNVRSTVFVEAHSMYRADGPEELRSVGEVEFAQGLAAASASGLYGPARAAAAIVGHADLTLGERVAPVLTALQAASPNRFRGIRHSVTWDPHPEINELLATHRGPGLLVSAAFQAGARVLAQMELSLDVFAYFHQLPELAELARAVPDLTIVMNHVGGILRIGPYAHIDDEMQAAWRRGIDAVAACPNVVVKLGGLTQPRIGWDWHLRATPIGSEELAQSLAPYIDYCIERFGPERCMFESNFPPDKVSCSYPVLWNGFKRLSAQYSEHERAAMFHDTAASVYRIAVQ